MGRSKADEIPVFYLIEIQCEFIYKQEQQGIKKSRNECGFFQRLSEVLFFHKLHCCRFIGGKQVQEVDAFGDTTELDTTGGGTFKHDLSG